MEKEHMKVSEEFIASVIEAKAKVKAMEAYLKAENYPDKHVMANILGIDLPADKLIPTEALTCI